MTTTEPGDEGHHVITMLLFGVLDVIVCSHVIATLVRWHLVSLGVPQVTATQVFVLMVVRRLALASMPRKDPPTARDYAVAAVASIILALAMLLVGYLLR